jgi:hypothetical protein
METDDAILQYCRHEGLCYTCFKEDPQDPVKLYLNFCHLCDKDIWYDTIRLKLSMEDLINYIKEAPKEWLELYKEELKRRS